MSFAVAADAYDRFMGRYSGPLTRVFADFAHIAPGLTVLDVGCGPGALTGELVARVGARGVAAVEPSRSFVEAVRERHPQVDVREAPAERLPFPDGEFDAAVAQLVVHFMSDPVAGLREMRRVTRRHGTVAACVWDHSEGGGGPLAPFWTAARRVDPSVRAEDTLPGSQPGDLTRFFTAAGLEHVHEEPITVRVAHASFEEWWEPYTYGVGPAGVHVASLDDAHRDALREACRELLPAAPFTISGTAWAARARA